MQRTLKQQLDDIRYVNNPVYDRIAEIVWEYVREQPLVALADEFTFRRDVAKLAQQVDRLAAPEDDDDETVHLDADLPMFSASQVSDSALLTLGGA